MQGPPKGNRFWERRKKHGANRKFADPETLWDACVEYFEWVVENPLEEEKIFQYEGNIVRGTIDKMRAMTKQGLCFFLGISDETWSNYRKRPEFTEMVETIDQVIYEQKFTGAAAGFLNAAIIGRELGLADKHEHTGKDGAPIETADKSPRQNMREILLALELLNREETSND